MKQLTDTERLEVAMMLLSEHEDLDQYAAICKKRELGCPDGLCGACQVAECAYPGPSDPETNGFHNTPAECEDRECCECELDADARTRLGIDCPYVD